MRRASGTAALLALVALAWPRSQPAAPAVPGVAANEPAAAAPTPVTSAAPVSTPTAAPAAPGRELLLPDGTTVPALNGAIDPAPLSQYWGPFPWSPIVGRERSSAGVEWYRHADGSYSTTEMVFVEQLGKQITLTRVAHPGPEQTPNTPPLAR